MANLDEKILKVWDKAIIVEKITVEGKQIEIDTERYRQDVCNAWIEKDAYGIEDSGKVCIYFLSS
jgi:aminopeptidase-like protein